MFLNQLISLLGQNRFTLDIMKQDQQSVTIIVIPKHTIPEQHDKSLAPLHAALVTPLRLTLPLNESLDNACIEQMRVFIESHKQATSTLNDIVKNIAEAEKMAKQAAKNKSDKSKKNLAPTSSDDTELDDDDNDNSQSGASSDQTTQAAPRSRTLEL